MKTEAMKWSSQNSIRLHSWIQAALLKVHGCEFNEACQHDCAFFSPITMLGMALGGELDSNQVIGLPGQHQGKLPKKSEIICKGLTIVIDHETRGG